MHTFKGSWHSLCAIRSHRGGMLTSFHHRPPMPAEVSVPNLPISQPKRSQLLGECRSTRHRSNAAALTVRTVASTRTCAALPTLSLSSRRRRLLCLLRSLQLARPSTRSQLATAGWARRSWPAVQHLLHSKRQHIAQCSSLDLERCQRPDFPTAAAIMSVVGECCCPQGVGKGLWMQLWAVAGVRGGSCGFDSGCNPFTTD